MSKLIESRMLPSLRSPKHLAVDRLRCTCFHLHCLQDTGYALPHDPTSLVADLG